MRAPAFVLALALSIGAVPAAAQQPERPEGVTPLTEQQLKDLPASTPEGEKFSLVYAKLNKQFGELLKLHMSPIGDKLLVKSAPLRTALEAGNDSDGARIVPRRTNLQVFLHVERGQGGPALIVDRVKVVESDLEQYTRRAQALPASDATKRQELARVVKARLQRFYQRGSDHDPDERRGLVALQRDLEEAARTIEQAQLPALPGGAETRIDFGRRYKALNVLAQVWGNAQVAAELRARAAEALERELGARLYLGRWYSYEDFKDLVDFEQVDGKWVPRERADLIRAADEQKKKLAAGEPTPFVSPQILQQSKEVVPGMNKDFVLGVTQAFPARVDRLREPGRDGTFVFEQWIMEDGLAIYFLRGTVFKVVAPASQPGTPNVGGE